MKKSFLLFIIFAILSSSKIYANVYASQLKVTNPDYSVFDGNFADGTGALLSFFLNDSATSVIIKIIEPPANVVYTIDLGSVGRGYHETLWDGTGAQSSKQYIYSVTAKQNTYSNTQWTIFLDKSNSNIFSRGLDIVKNMNDPNFGLMYAPNNGGPLGKGITIYYPDASQYDEFLVAKDISAGGIVDWGSGSDPMTGGVLDDLGRFYVSSIPNGELKRLNKDFSVTSVLTNFTNPLGAAIVGTGAERTIYLCSENKILRAKIGDADSFNDFVEEIGVFDNVFPRSIVLDEENNMYVSFRTNATDLNSTGAGLYKFNIGGNLPVGLNDALWSFEESVTHKISDLELDFGNDLNSNTDDILYYATRADANNNDDGIWKIADLNSAFIQPEKVITELELYGADDNINARSGISLDAAGNLVLFENANEHIFFLSPPSTEAENSFETTAPELVNVSVATDIDENSILESFSLSQNYPNPFNPSTKIRFVIPNEVRNLNDFQIANQSQNVSLKVYDVLGKEVATLVNEQKPAGNYEVKFDASKLSSGIYFYTLTAGSKNITKKMILLR